MRCGRSYAVSVKVEVSSSGGWLMVITLTFVYFRPID